MPSTLKLAADRVDPRITEILSRSILAHQTSQPFRGHTGDQTALFRVRNQLGSPTDKSAVADFDLIGLGLRHDLERRRAVVANALCAFGIIGQATPLGSCRRADGRSTDCRS